MLKEQAKLLNRITRGVDVALVTAAFLLAFHVRRGLGGGGELNDFAWFLLFIIPVWHFFLARYRLYESIRTASLKAVAAAVVKVHFFGGVAASSAIYLVGAEQFSRRLLLLFLVFSLLLVTAGKVTTKLLFGHLRRRGFNARHIVVVGTVAMIRRFLPLLETHRDWGLRVIGIVEAKDEPGSDSLGYLLLGDMAQVAEVCKRNTVDEVVFCLPKEYLPGVDGHIRAVQELGVTARMVLDLYDAEPCRRELSLLHGEMPVLTFYRKAFDSTQLLVKRAVDVAGALAGLAGTAVLFPFIAVAIRLDSPGPLFFGQERVGENGRTFTCWKFRSMHVDAEARKKELLHLNEMSGAMFKMRNDPRITRVGRFLRATSLDELPQFWNVLKGEMSLVGTRPPTPDEVAGYQNWQRRRICIKPGITGLWQVSGRSRVRDFDGIVRLDLEYIDSWNLWLDLKILAKTFFVVLSRDGSC